MEWELSHIVEDGDLAELRAVLDADPGLAASWDCNGLRLAHLVANSDDPDKLWLAVERGADIAARGYRGKTPLHAAAHQGADKTGEQLIGMLVRRGLPLDTLDDEGRTPLFWAVNDQCRGSRGAATIVGLLLRGGAPLDLPTAVVLGQTAVVRAQLLAAPPSDADLSRHANDAPSGPTDSPRAWRGVEYPVVIPAVAGAGGRDAEAHPHRSGGPRAWPRCYRTSTRRCRTCPRG